MKVSFDIDSKSQAEKFRRLGTWYILALSVIAAVALVGQLLIQKHLQSQTSDSHIVNLAGTQRYRSQAIVKMSLLLYNDIDHHSFPDKVATLQSILAVWKKDHEYLQRGTYDYRKPSGAIVKMFEEINPYFDRVYKSAQQVIAHKTGMEPDKSIVAQSIRQLLDNESVFLDKMDRIVLQFDQEASEKISSLSKLEYILFALSLIVIALEILFIFRPTTQKVSQAISQLSASEKNAKQLSKEIGALYTSLEKSYEELSIVNQPVENPRLYAKADRGGNVTFIGEAIQGEHSPGTNYRLCDLFPGMSHPDDWMDNVIDVVSEGESWQGEVRFGKSAREGKWTQVIITPIFNEAGEVEELIMTGADVTQRKEAEQNMNVKNRAEVEKKINQQKFRSVLILEGQEEERKRIAMDIHDGIGQMLTSLKFQIESIDLSDNQKAGLKIKEIESMIKEVIREVRKVTFNLKPTVLGDFGLQAALNVFVKEIGKLTDIKIVLIAPSEIDRLPQKIENNIFRIVQEAINNAIKYSKAEQITVELHQVNDELNIVIADNGKGFDASRIDARKVNIDSGRGFFNMYERTDYINGQLTIDTSADGGTRVMLKVPVGNSVLVE